MVNSSAQTSSGQTGGHGPGGNGGGTGTGTGTGIGTETPIPSPVKLCRFHGSVKLDTLRIGRDAGRIGEEVIRHLAALVGANVDVTLEINAFIPEGAPEKVVRDVTENCRTLRFNVQGFEET